MVDLRWGIRSILSGDHEAFEVFLQEITNCQKISAGPAFTVSLSHFHKLWFWFFFHPYCSDEIVFCEKAQRGFACFSFFLMDLFNFASCTHCVQPASTYYSCYGDERKHIHGSLTSIQSWRTKWQNRTKCPESQWRIQKVLPLIFFFCCIFPVIVIKRIYHSDGSACRCSIQ